MSAAGAAPPHSVDHPGPLAPSAAVPLAPSAAGPLAQCAAGSLDRSEGGRSPAADAVAVSRGGSRTAKVEKYLKNTGTTLLPP